MSWLLETRGVSKSFSGVRVLNEVSFYLKAGEVHALVGENGAGKSTFMKVLAGVHGPDAGEIWLKGQKIELPNAQAALKAGIAMIYQEPLPFLDLTVAENIFMGQEPASRWLGWIDKEAMRREAERLLSRLGVALSPKRKMRELRLAEVQVVEIAKALAHEAEVIIMDEPTSALTEHEWQALFRIVCDLREHGVGVIYISHKLEEVFRLANRVTVLRDGCHVTTSPIGELTRDRLIGLMVGRDVREVFPKVNAAKGEAALSVRGLGKAGRFREVSFEVKRGEILGLAGLMGAGRTDVVNAIYGLDPADAGEIRVGDREVSIGSPSDALEAGIGLVSEDRKVFGFVPRLGIRRNMTLASLRRWCGSGFIRHEAEGRATDEQIRSLGIKAEDRDQPVERLSGGNQQKVVIGRTLLTEPEVLLLDEPTRGIDVGAKAEVHALIGELVRAGKAVVLVSSELPELMSLSDRILVMRQGRVAAELEAQGTTPEEIMKFAILD